MSLPSFTPTQLPDKPGFKYAFGGLIGSSFSLNIANAILKQGGFSVLIATNSASAAKLERELKFFLAAEKMDMPVMSFPDWETLPYDAFSPHPDIISERLKTLYQLIHIQKGVLIVPVATLMHRVCPKEYLLQNSLWLKKGQDFDLNTVRKQLVEAGYRYVTEVSLPGEYAIRGSILDLYPTGSDRPYRVELFDKEIESIRIFDPETQRSLEKINEIQLLPAREFPLNEEAIAKFRTQFRDLFEGDPRQCSLYLDVSEGNVAPGIEYYLPLFFDKTCRLFDYFPKNTLILEERTIETAANTFWEEVKERYNQYSHDRLRPLLAPHYLFLQTSEIFEAINQFPILSFTTEVLPVKAGNFNFPANPLPHLQIATKESEPLQLLKNYLHTFKGKVLFSAESAGRREVLKEWLHAIGSRPTTVNDWSSFLKSTSKLCIIISPLEEGVILNNELTIITEGDLLGKRVMQRRLRQTRKPIFDMELKSLAELKIGDPVVHLDHGIGRYQGLVKLTLVDQEGEFLALEYAGSDKLYVPVTALNLISRYSGLEGDKVAVHRLGTDQWQKAKRKAIEEVRDTAAELLEIYAKRAAKKGFAFPKPDEQYEAFSAEFPFEETPDQQKAIAEVIEDLTAARPMDRVVCGDVGFGKTEVALRAAFLVVNAGKQVAVLVPTTLLAEQHFQTFLDRFSGFPVRIEVISRFRSAKEQTTICEKIKEGQIDILIGTHKILQDRIQFKSLGLLVIDEEHRFGVRQKEAFKSLRSEVDILTLTATPIPRTLNMAMAGLRDLSIIATPPLRRLSIKTFVRERNSALIFEAISRELHRGGQVYFLHNSVETILREARDLEALVPSARIAVAHGQMPERELERIMTDFYHRRYNVLVSTTIIETGIDIPTANTIIIDRADKFGLAQLHQLRGRVGRSHHQAYAFCLLPAKLKISSDATKRLEVLEAMEELGAGFSLATHDLEIRGAGELLGDSQSGHIQTVGYTLYMELLDEAIQSLKKNGSEDDIATKSVEINLQMPTFIPEIYVPDIHNRLVLYKRISNCKNNERLEDLRVEMIDRFGSLPLQTVYLFQVTELKLQAEILNISKIEMGAKGGRLEFHPNPRINPDAIIRLIQQKSQHFRLDGPNRLKVSMDLSDNQKRIETVKELMDTLRLS